MGLEKTVSRVEAVSRPRGQFVRRWVGAHASMSLLVLNLFLWVGESWWPVSLLLFLPRWVFLGPLIALLPLVAWSRDRWSAALFALGALVTLGPIMEWNWPRWTTSPSTREQTVDRLRVLTFNEENDHFAGQSLVDLLEREGIDLVCLQEWYPDPIVESYFRRGWHLDPSGCVASRHPIERSLDLDVVRQGDPNLVRVLVRLPSGRLVQMASVHGESMRFGIEHLARGDVTGLETVIARRASRLRRIRRAVDENRDLPTLIAGDFNTPSPSPLLRAFRPHFREAFQEAGRGFGYTWPSVFPGLRIDQVLVGPEWRVTRCWVGEALGSDHCPMIAEVELPALPGR